MRDPLMLYYFQTPAGRAVQCPPDRLDVYFKAVEEIFGLPPGDAERILMRTQLSTQHVTFWSVRLGEHREPALFKGDILQ